MAVHRETTSSEPAGNGADGHAHAPALTPTGRVILGMLAQGEQTGYDIKQAVDSSTRFFWAASYGQIYPELRRLEQSGLVRGRPEPSGERARTIYELTDAGGAALHDWLASDDEPLYELRDEAMLKLFFSDSAPEHRLNAIRAMRDRGHRKVAALQAVRQRFPEMGAGPRLTLELGIEMTQRRIEWCDAAERRLARKKR